MSTRSTSQRSTGFEVGGTYRVPPGALVIGANVRSDTHPGAKEFAASIKARGVLEPITAWVDDDGNLVVYRGQRRTLAAASVGTPDGLVPVHVVTRPAEVDRVTDQLVENVHRAAMRAAEERDAIEQLSLLGVSAAQITKRTAITRPTVDAALTVSASQTARERMDATGMTLEAAATFAEFEDDPQAIQALEQALSWGRPLEHTAQRLRDARAEETALRAHAQLLRGQGVPVLDPQDVPDRAWTLHLDALVTADGEPVPEHDWPSVPGAAVLLRAQWAYPDERDDPDTSTTTATVTRSRPCGSCRCGSAPTRRRPGCGRATTAPARPPPTPAPRTRTESATAGRAAGRSSPTTPRGGPRRRSAGHGWRASSPGPASRPGPRH
jgi:ParB family chromosome partitioning protein